MYFCSRAALHAPLSRPQNKKKRIAFGGECEFVYVHIRWCVCALEAKRRGWVRTSLCVTLCVCVLRPHLYASLVILDF